MFKILVGFLMKSRHALTNFQKSRSFNRKHFVHHRFYKFEEYRLLLMKILGLDRIAAGKVLCNVSVLDIPKECIIKQCELCNELHIDPRSLVSNVNLLFLRPHILTTRVTLLRDMGVPKIHAAVISNFHATMSLRVKIFKAYMDVPSTVNIADNLLQCLHEPPPWVPPLEELSEDMTVNEYYKRCLLWYIPWRFDVHKDDVETIDLILCRMRHRSFSLMKSLFDVLHGDVGLTIEQIKTHGCVSAGSAEDLRAIIADIKTFAGVDFKKLIRRHPVLYRMQYKNVVEVMELLKKYDYSDAAMLGCPEVLLMNSSVVTTRLKTVEDVPELRVLKNNAKVLRMIYKFHIAQLRLEYLRYLNIKNATMNLLIGHTVNFKKFVKSGIDHTKGREIGFSVGKLLKLEIKEIRRRIQKHPYWRHIDLVAIRESLEFLLERFAPEDLYDNLQILLYPREKIADVLERLSEENKTYDKEKRFTPKQMVAICLYEIEKEHHFSGDGVWKYDASAPIRREHGDKQIESADSDNSDSEPAESEEKEQPLSNEQIK